MTQLVDDLRSARANVERGWCQGATALDANDRPVNSGSPQVTRVCAMGAIDRAGDWAGNPERTNAMAVAVYGVLDCVSIVDWNDKPDRTQADVIAAFDRAIAAAEQAP